MSADFAWGVLAAFVFLAAAIAVTAAVWDLPRDGIDLGDDPAEPSPLATWQDSREAYRNVRVLPPAQAVKGQAPGSGPVPTIPPLPTTDEILRNFFRGEVRGQVGPFTASAPVTLTHYLVGDNVIDLRDGANTTTGDIA